MSKLRVSIHYMSLVQINDVPFIVIFLKFQYIICRWFKYLLSFYQYEHTLFQYIICRWFKEHGLFFSSEIKLFQYIICRWFKISEKDIVASFVKFQYIICRWFKIVIVVFCSW